MCYTVLMDDTDETTAPANQPLSIVPTIVAAVGEEEIVEMLVEESRFKGEPELRAAAARLLEAGYTVQSVARRLKIRASTVWKWSSEPEIAASIRSGAEYRRKVIGQDLEAAAEDALSALVEIVRDPGINPKDRVKASEVILDRCGLISGPESGQTTAIAVDIDFDERLARIVAGNRT